MRSLKRTLISALAILVTLGSFGIASAAPYYTYQPTLLPQISNAFDLGTSTQVWRNLYVSTVCLSADCRSVWPTGGGGGGSGNVATSTAETAGQLSYWTSTAGTPATLGKVATSTVTFSGPFVIPSTLGTLVGGSNSTITYTGLATTSQPASSNLLVSNGGAGVFGVATSSATINSPLSGTIVGVGSGLSLSIANAAADGSTKGAASFTANDFDATTGNISLDYTNGQAASASAKGFLTAADWRTFNNKVGTTSASETAGQVAIWGTTSGTPASLYSVATSSFPTISGPFVLPSTLGKLIGGSGSITYTGLATTSQPASSNLLVSNGGTGVFGVATTTVSCTGAVSCSSFNILGSSPITITGTSGTGLATSTPIAGGNVLVYSASGAGSAFGIATSTFTASSPLTGSFTQLGSGGSLGCTTASASAAGCISIASFNTFNNKVGTSTNETAGQLAYWTSSSATPATIGKIATTTLAFSGPFNGAASIGTLVGGSNTTVTWTGLSTTSAISQGQVLYATSASGVASVATSSETCSSGITCTAHAVLTGGGAITLATINAGVLGAQTNAVVPTSQATSTLYGTGTGGQVLGWNNTTGGIAWVATSSAAGGTTVTTTFASSTSANPADGTYAIPNASGISVVAGDVIKWWVWAHKGGTCNNNNLVSATIKQSTMAATSSGQNTVTFTSAVGGATCAASTFGYFVATTTETVYPGLSQTTPSVAADGVSVMAEKNH